MIGGKIILKYLTNYFDNLKKLTHFCRKLSNLSKNMESKFEEYLKGKLTTSQFEDGLRNLFGSPHRRTKVLANAKIISHSELLDLAELLDVTSFSLFTEFQCGMDALSLREIEQLEMIHGFVAPGMAKHGKKERAAMAA